MRPRDLDIDLSTMMTLEKPINSRNPGMVLSISEKNRISMNSVFLREVKAKVPTMLVKFLYQADYRVIALQAGQPGENVIKFHMDGTLKHCDFVNQLREAGYQIPGKYIVEWNEAQQAWIGILEEVPKLDDINTLLKNASKKGKSSRRRSNVEI